MPNLRPHALIGLASAAAAIAPMFRVAAPFEGVQRVERPQVYATVFARDTVFFCASAYPAAHRTAYAFIRSTRAWRSVAKPTRCPAPPAPYTWWIDSTLALGRGIGVFAVRAPVDSQGNRAARSFLRISDSTRDRVFALKPEVAPTRVTELIGALMVDQDTTSVGIGASIVTDSLIWLGLIGGFPEGDGSLGGIYRIDRRTGDYEYVVDTTLARHAVTGMAVAGEYLWTGTEYLAEYGPFAGAGLLRMNLKSRAWRRYGVPQLPDALIRHVGSDGRLLAVATEKGLAIAELVPSRGGDVGRWTTRHFVPAFAGDSLVFRLGPKSEAELGELAEAPVIFAQRFAAPGKERAVVEALRLAPRTRVRDVLEHSGSEATLFTAPTSARAVLSLLAGDVTSQVIAAGALDNMAARVPASAVPVVRRSFTAIDTVTTEHQVWGRTRAMLGRVLTRRGDSTAVRWARAVLDRAAASPVSDSAAAAVRYARAYDVGAAASILAHSRDLDALPVIHGLIPTLGSFKSAVVDGLTRYNTREAWATLVVLARADAQISDTVLAAVPPSAMRDSTIVGHVRELTTRGLADSTPERFRETVETVRRLRMIEFAPHLIARMGRAPRYYWLDQAIYETLISLTGRADAPVWPRDMPVSATDWWRKVLEESGGTLPRASAAAGERALATWTARQGRAVRAPSTQSRRR